jgi:hypothetical protein
MRQSDSTIPYFAYGSNIRRARLEARVSVVSKVGNAYLPDYRFICDKPGQDNTGKANIIDWHGDGVWGVIYNLTLKQIRRLDIYEGQQYQREDVQTLCDGVWRTTQAYISYATPTGENPHKWYKDHIITGAKENSFPTEYVLELEDAMKEAYE